jgi:hypothetical protein
LNKTQSTVNFSNYKSEKVGEKPKSIVLNGFNMESKEICKEDCKEKMTKF